LLTSHGFRIGLLSVSSILSMLSTASISIPCCACLVSVGPADSSACGNFYFFPWLVASAGETGPRWTAVYYLDQIVNSISAISAISSNIFICKTPSRNLHFQSLRLHPRVMCSTVDRIHSSILISDFPHHHHHHSLERSPTTRP
jgi:hypothetical protein